MPNALTKCCHCTKMPYNPPYLLSVQNRNINFYSFIKNIDRIMQSNQTGNGVCSRCKFLIEQIVPDLPEKNFIKFITVNHFTKCNSNCIYCAIHNKIFNPKYKLLPVIEKLVKQNMINKDCLINWGGGEPVICTEFKQLADFFHKNKIQKGPQ